MTTPHKATPEQWAQIEQFAEDCGYDSCLLELRDRVETLEADQWLRQHAKSKETIEAPITRDRDETGDYLIIHDTPFLTDSLAEQGMEALGPEPLPETGPTEDIILNMGSIERHRRICAALKRLAELESSQRHAAMAELRAASAEARPADGGLVERVQDVIGHAFPDDARAAILAVAEWSDAIGYSATASILRQELQRHG